MLRSETKRLHIRAREVATWSALIAAFAICLSVVLFSSPFPEKRDLDAPQVAKCCETDAGKIVFVSSSSAGD
jgi:hypothetical protein